MRKTRADRQPKELPAFPMLQMFGGLIGVLLVIVVISAINVRQTRLSQITPENIVGIQTVDLSAKPQIKLFLYRDYVLIEQTGQKVALASLMQPNNAMTAYLRPYLGQINSRNKELFLMLYPDANRTMFAMRQLFSRIGSQYFNLLLLNDELIQQLLATDS
ncbi:MAG: hypothetical protein ACI8WB_004006 [Phenylobacterium sp.]|jgi:hypothetical protein